MLKIALCDNDMEFLKCEKKIIESYLESLEYKHKIILFMDGDELMALERKIVEFDIICLDIKMKKVDGMKVAYKLREYSKKTFLVFVTAFAPYAIEGYKVNAIRYLLKGQENFREAILECFDTILKQENMSNVVFYFKEGYRKIGLADLIYIESSLHTLMFHMNNGKVYTMKEKLDNINMKLKEYNFVRIHKSYLVNVSYIAEIKRYQAKLQ